MSSHTHSHDGKSFSGLLPCYLYRAAVNRRDTTLSGILDMFRACNRQVANVLLDGIPARKAVRFP